jgi:vacuolar-type H+-ATPase subunit I/STV1
MVSTFYFSYDEEGHTFFEDAKSLMVNTPRIEDCYVFVGDTTQEEIEEDWENYREVNVLEYLQQKKKEKEKPLIAGMDEIVEYIKTLEIKNKKLEEQNKELEEKVDEANKIMKEYKELKEFKEKAEEECEASAVMDTMMNRIKEAERKENMWYVNYKNQEPLVKEIRKENELLIKYFVEDYDLNTADTIRGSSWNDRMRNFYNQVMSRISGVSWWDFFENYDIAYESGDGICEYYKDDEETRIQYCQESLGLNEDDENYNKIVNDEENDFDWDEQENDFIHWYIRDYCNGYDYWCDYDGNYWYIKQ